MKTFLTRINANIYSRIFANKAVLNGYSRKFAYLIAIAILAGIVAWQGVCFAWSISGTVYDRDGKSVIPRSMFAAKIILNDGTTDLKQGVYDNSTGEYYISDVPSGTYIVKIQGAELGQDSVHKFDPNQRSVTVADQDVTGVDFIRINRPPTFTIPDYIIEEGEYFEMYLFGLSNPDPDRDGYFTFECSSCPEGAFFAKEKNSDLFQWVPDYNQEGVYEITFTASDSWGGSSQATTTITVLNNPVGSAGDLKITSKVRNWPSDKSGPAPIWVDFGIKNIPSIAIPYVMNYHSHNTVWWKFGDKGTSYWPKPTQVFPEVGNYNVKLIITDNQSNILAQNEIAITAEQPPPPENSYYLSVDGNDSNNGLTPQTAWKTIKHAVWQLKKGDTLKILDGTYYAEEGIFIEQKNGSPDKWITIEAADGSSPVITGNGIGIGFGAPYVKIRNLNCTRLSGTYSNYLLIEGCNFSDFSMMTPISQKGLIMRNNEFRLSTAGSYFGSIRSDGVLIENNNFYWQANGEGLLFKGPYTTNIEIRYNKFIVLPGVWASGALSGGVWGWPDAPTMWEGTYFNIHDNLFYKISTPVFIVYSAKDLVLFNNTVYSPDKVTLIYYHRRGTGTFHEPYYVTLKNNIFYTGTLIDIYAELLLIDPGCATGFVSDSNIWYAGGSQVLVTWQGSTKSFSDYVTQTGNDSHSKTEDPKLNDPANEDLHLKSDSPAIDAGITFPSIPVDYDGNIRSQGTGVDIGAYEYAGDVPILPGDFDGDNDVDIQDLIIVAKDYGVTYDLQDLLLVAMHYGEKTQY